MKKHFLAGILVVALFSVAATTYTIDQLTNNATPSNGTVIEVYDPSASPKSGKYTLTNKANATPVGITNALGYVPLNKAGDTVDGSFSTKGSQNQYQSTLTQAGGSITLPFDPSGINFYSCSITGACTINVSGLATNRSAILCITGCSTNSALTWSGTNCATGPLYLSSTAGKQLWAVGICRGATTNDLTWFQTESP